MKIINLNIDYLKKIRVRDHVIPSWHQFRVLGQSRVVNSAVLFPVVGYYILFGEQFQSHLVLLPEFASNQCESNQLVNWVYSWSRAHLLYLGMLFIAVASIVYQLFCPGLIKEYSSARSYLALDTQRRSLYQLKYIVNEILNIPDHKKRWYSEWILDVNNSYGPVFDKSETISQLRGAFRSDTAGFGSVDGEFNERLEDATNVAMLMFYSVSSWSRQKMRTITAVSYILGFGLVTASSIPVMLRVLEIIIT